MGNLVKVAQKSDLPQGKGMMVEINGKRIALFHIDGQFYAMDDECTHAGGTLNDGSIDGCKVTCPWHGAEFDIRTGEALSAPAFDKVKTYQVKVQGEELFLEF